MTHPSRIATAGAIAPAPFIPGNSVKTAIVSRHRLSGGVRFVLEQEGWGHIEITIDGSNQP